MVIIQQPDAISLSANLKKIIVSAGSEVALMLKEGDVVLLDTTYEPGTDGRVTIDLRDAIESRLSYLLSHLNFYEQTGIVKTFTAFVNDTPIAFRVIRGGVANLQDTASNWLRQNFLTWQPVNKLITYYSPEWLTYYAQEACSIKLKAYFPDDAVQNYNLGACEVGKAFTCNLQYALVSGLLGQKYPTHYDVWVENSAGVMLTYVQRYLYSGVKSEQEQWFLFENSLGGLDTVRAYGDTDFEGVHEHNISTSDDISSEYRIDTKRTYKKNTGYLNEYERRWILDFFPSRKKYVHHDSSIRSIVVTQSDVKYTASDLPSSFNFTYRFSESIATLNLIRKEIPANLTLPNIESPDFSLPPRLVEFPRVPLHEGVIIPAFDPNSEDPAVTTFGAILSAVVGVVLQKLQAGEGGGELVDILRVNATEDPSDFNVFSAARTLIEIYNAIQVKGADYFISKTKSDTAAGLIKFLAGAEFGEFVSGMFAGKGARIDKDGNAEVTSLMARELIEAPEFRYNRITLVGDEINVGAGGLIVEVEEQMEGVYLLHIKLEDGEFIPFLVGDIIKGIFNQSGGFLTSWFRVDNVDHSGGTMLVTMGSDSAVPGGRNYPPAKFMNIAKQGSFTDSTRQSNIIISAKTGSIIMLDGVDNYGGGYVSALWGKPSGLEGVIDITKLPVNPDQTYIYSRGALIQDLIRIDYQGNAVKDVRDRGTWSIDVAQSENPYRSTTTMQDDVWQPYGRFRCIVDKTLQVPGFGATDWVQIEGDPTVRIELYSSEGNEMFSDDFSTTVTAAVFRGSEEITMHIADSDWEWIRETTDPVSDTIWNADHADVTHTLELTFSDMGNKIHQDRVCIFTCLVFVRSLNVMLQKSFGYEGF